MPREIVTRRLTGGTQYGYWENGQFVLHREDGPAVVDDRAEGMFWDGCSYEAWYLNGVRHRDDGPARIWYTVGGVKMEEYWIEGVRYDEGIGGRRVPVEESVKYDKAEEKMHSKRPGEDSDWADDIISQIGDVISEEDTVNMVDRFNAQYPNPGVNNGMWWRMNSWREKMPQGYVSAPCADCGKPLAKPSTVVESVSCEFCQPPEIL